MFKSQEIAHKNQLPDLRKISNQEDWWHRSSVAAWPGPPAAAWQSNGPWFPVEPLPWCPVLAQPACPLVSALWAYECGCPCLASPSIQPQKPLVPAKPGSFHLVPRNLTTENRSHGAQPDWRSGLTWSLGAHTFPFFSLYWPREKI